jgi:Fe-S cluster assembly iron-binding protein IscA
MSSVDIFTKHNTNGTTMTLIYVDDIIITCNNQIEIDHTNKNLKGKFEIKDLGNFKYFF